MKKLLLSVACSAFLFGFVNPLPDSSKSLENGGTLSAIDAYQDGVGVGAMVVQQGRGVDNSAMNALVFKYGNEAKNNTMNLGDQVILTGSAEDKLLAGKLFADGVTCTDNLSNTINDVYLNSICTGKLVVNPSCTNGTMSWNVSTNLCEKGGSSTYAAIGTNQLIQDNCEGGAIYAHFNATNYCSGKGYRLPLISETTLSGGIIQSCNNARTWSNSLVAGGNFFVAYTKTFTNSGTIDGGYYETFQTRCVKDNTSYTCPSGGTLSGTTCTISTLQTANGFCQSGYTLTNNKCVQN